MEVYKIDSLKSVTNELILSLIDRYKMKEVKRMNRLNDYYFGKADIKKRVMSDTAKPNNKISNPYASYIVDTVQGYFLGKPISYSSDNSDLMEKVQEVYDKNSEQAHNSKLGKQLSITGVAYELMYMNESNDVKFAMLDPREVFIIYDNSIEQKALCAVRFYEVHDYITNNSITYVEVYTDNSIQYFKVDEGNMMNYDEQPHYFNEVPVIMYKNNDEMTGDFEKIIDLIDAYDLAVSDTANSLEYFADAYLVLTNMEGTEASDIAEMKENRVMLLGENGKAQWLIKDSQNMEVEAYKDRLKEDIHNLSNIPNLNDDAFGTATSGESLKYKLFGLENAVSIKERNFKKGLEKRIELITNILNIKGGQFAYNDVKMQFVRNLPTNNVAWADIASKLAGIVSQETLLSILPFVDDVALEMEKMSKEKEGTMYENFFPNETDVNGDME